MMVMNAHSRQGRWKDSDGPLNKEEEIKGEGDNSCDDETTHL